MLAEELRKVRGPGGEVWNTKVFKPEELYPVVNGDPPDLMVFFDDLYWRSAGTLGWDTVYLRENDRGPDDAVHDWRGVLTIYDPEETLSGGRRVYRLEEVYRLFLELMGCSNESSHCSSLGL